MIKIIKHQSEEKEIAVKFLCYCGCEFWADNDSILMDKTAHVSHYTVYHSICPDCHKEIYSVNKPVERDIVFNK